MPDRASLGILAEKLSKNEKLLSKNTGNIDALLAKKQIDPVQHTLGYLWLLHAKATNSEIKDQQRFVEECRGLFIDGHAESLRMAFDKVAATCGKMVQSLIMCENPIRGVLPLRAAVAKLTEHKTALLTPVHRHFLLICIKSRCYRAAIPVLDQPTLEVDAKLTKITAQEYLEYNYYGAMCCIALKRYTQGLEMLQMALSAPSHVLSAIQLEAFKKYLLLCLIVHGERVALPSQSVSRVVMDTADRLCVPYVDLAKAFTKGVDETRKCVEEYADLFTKDKNFGLIKQCLKALTRRDIQRLTNTYVALSLGDIAKVAKLDNSRDAEAHVLEMIRQKNIFAKIDQKDGILSFLDDPEEYDSAEMVAQMNARIQNVIGLSAKLTELNRTILLDPNYVRNTMPAVKGRGEGGEFMQGSTGGGMGGMSQEDRDLAKALEASKQHQ